ncbi:Unknown protein [Striga hermonthica]|uniref:DUF4378 domain-containing protein n=1 Tax=Striga hermonthica TaxID=68872 RepID=A0A9N7RH30_STRHE|nr:Unknown protein [Striga hermonthica]
MARKQFLRELLAEDQEPFRLNTFIADRRRSHLNNPPSLHLRKRRPPSALRRHACFLSFQNSPDARKSPLFVPPSPAKCPRLHVPSRTAALLVEAAMRIHKHHQQQQPRPKAHGAKTVGLGLFGSFLKRLKDRSSRSKRRVVGDSDFKSYNGNATSVEEDDVRVSVSCSCSNNWTENNEDNNKSLDSDEDSTSDCGSEDINSDFKCRQTRFCPSPFVFSLQRTPSSPGRRTPDFCSPAASPSRRVNQDKENYESHKSNNAQGGEEEEEDKEQCSPVSVLDNTPYDDDDEHENRDADDYVTKCSYENVQRARQQLLYRLQRFEKLAELDTTELEREVRQGSDDEDLHETDESDGDEQLPMYEEQSTVENILTRVFDKSNLGYNSRNVLPDMKRLVYDIIVEEDGEVAFAENNDVLIGRICRRLDSWREVEPNTIDMMVGFDFKGEFGRWKKFDEQLGDVSTEIEVAIYGLLVEEISDELLNMDGKCLQF